MQGISFASVSTVLTIIGLTLLPVAAGWITGQATLGTAANPDYLDKGNIGLAAFTLVVILVLTKIPRLSRLAILLGLVVGTLAALVVGRTDFSLDGAKVVAAPTPSPSAARCSPPARSSPWSS